jgi:hypothetical protein
MTVYQDLFGTWGGVLTVFIIVVAALGIPVGIALVLNREIKGPAEKSHPEGGKVLPH